MLNQPISATNEIGKALADPEFVEAVRKLPDVSCYEKNIIAATAEYVGGMSILAVRERIENETTQI